MQPNLISAAAAYRQVPFPTCYRTFTEWLADQGLAVRVRGRHYVHLDRLRDRISTTLESESPARA